MSTDTSATVTAWVVKLQRGDESACEPLARMFLRSCYAVALAVLRHPQDAEDAAQEALVRAMDRVDQLREPERFTGWLMQIVRNEATSLLKKRNNRSRQLSRFDSLDPQGAPVAPCGLRADLLDALDTLGQTQREVLLLHDMGGWTHAQTGSLLGITEVNSRQYLFTARKAMRQTMESRPVVQRSKDG
jgi:RNA polymerase sigma-70 factor, ECF subfamily